MVTKEIDKRDQPIKGMSQHKLNIERHSFGFWDAILIDDKKFQALDLHVCMNAKQVKG
jgi:hypothetical protein